ncbi:unnamed protein product [Adineta steineri]|uniref:Peptidase S1 domain-containing protein n=1 Tax=Adineta steineri TaxID=433720 RepID=A0A814QGK5_9BILA|nr:unnamed protein product [Adineta steineri]CAF3767781.1 unnamed protein product [Adineta steineri]
MRTIDQNDYIPNSTRSYSPYEPEKNVKKIKRTAIILLIIALILVITLVVSIALVFTIGLRAAKKTSNIESSTSTILSGNSLYEPCRCGCPSIQPLFSDGTSLISRIVNGETSRAHSWPWQVLLVVIDRNQTPIAYCGGSIITNRHILTAAHCVHQHYPPFIFIFPGQHTLNFSVSLKAGYLVNNIYIHEGYNVLLHNDLAIITIEEPLRFDSSIHPICLATLNSPPLQPGEELIATGWGRISGAPNTAIRPSYLQQVKLAYVPTLHPNCSGLFPPELSAHPGQMCVGKPGYNVCQGDSGGPLVRRMRIPNTETFCWEQVGVTSATKDCGWNSTYPDIFINIPYYYDWIAATVKRAV